jgi:hypothetical protein
MCTLVVVDPDPEFELGLVFEDGLVEVELDGVVDVVDVDVDVPCGVCVCVAAIVVVIEDVNNMSVGIKTPRSRNFVLINTW